MLLPITFTVVSDTVKVGIPDTPWARRPVIHTRYAGQSHSSILNRARRIVPRVTASYAIWTGSRRVCVVVGCRAQDRDGSSFIRGAAGVDAIGVPAKDNICFGGKHDFSPFLGIYLSVGRPAVKSFAPSRVFVAVDDARAIDTKGDTVSIVGWLGGRPPVDRWAVFYPIDPTWWFVFSFLPVCSGGGHLRARGCPSFVVAQRGLGSGIRYVRRFVYLVMCGTRTNSSTFVTLPYTLSLLLSVFHFIVCCYLDLFVCGCLGFLCTLPRTVRGQRFVW